MKHCALQLRAAAVHRRRALYAWGEWYCNQCMNFEHPRYRYQYFYSSSSSPSSPDHTVSNRRRPLYPSLVQLLNDSKFGDEKTSTDPLQIRMEELSQQTQSLIDLYLKNDATGQNEDKIANEDQLRSSYLTLMNDWFHLQSDIAQKTNTNNTVSHRQGRRIHRREIPPKSSPNYSLITCAENMHTLLHHDISLLKRKKTNNSSLEQETTLPFQLAMKAWNQTSSYHSTFCYPLAGDYCASILDEWGSLLGGNLIHSPTTDAFNIVLETYAFCSSGPYEFFISSSHVDTTLTTSSSLPAIQAWDIFQILNQDFVLRPTMETYCHIITILKNHAFALHYSQNQSSIEVQDRKQRELSSSSSSSSFLNSRTASSLAFQNFTMLEDMVIKSSSSWDEIRTWSSHSYQPLELLILEAFTNILAMISRGFLSEKDFHHAYPKTRTLNTYGEQAELILDRFLGIVSKIRIHPDTDTSHTLSEYVGDSFLSCMIAWAKDQDEQHTALDKVQIAESIMRLFHQLQSYANQYQWDDRLPHSSHYYKVFNAYAQSFENVSTWSESDTKEMLKLQPYRKCWNILEHLEERDYSHRLYVNEPLDIPLIYCKTISVLSQSIRYNLCPRDIMMVVNNAETALTTLTHKYNIGALRIYDPQDITRAFNHVMLIHSQLSIHKLTGNKISNLFMELIDLSKSNNRNPPKPDSYTYGLYMNHLSQSTTDESVNKMVTVLTNVEKQNESGNSEVTPNVAHYSTVLKMLGKVGGKKNSMILMDIFNRAENRLYQSVTDHIDNEDKYLSPVVLYSSYVSGLADSGYPTCGYEALKTLRLLKQRYHETRDAQLQPDIIMYSVVLDAIAKSKVIDRSIITEAQAIVDEIEAMFYDGIMIIPNRIIYTAMMKIWSKSSLDEAPAKCIELIEKMIKMYNETGNEDIRPDVVSYSVVLDSISRSSNPESVDTALMLLKDMEDRSSNGVSDLKPNVIVYTKVINAIWKSGHDNAGGLAEKILDRMEELCHGGDFTTNPDCYTYTSVINCWARSVSFPLFSYRLN